jgi:uroporphyrinogen decarboxylase
MNSRDIVRRTIEFGHPERVARSFEPSDFVFGGPEIPNSLDAWRRIGEHDWQRVDEWGNIWGRVDETSKGQVIRGVLRDLNQVSICPLPDFANSSYYAHAREIFANAPERWHVGSVQGFTFKMAQGLRKFDQYLMDLVSEPERISLLHDRIDEQIGWQIRRLSEAGADSIMFWEDWGTQERTFISPRVWRREFKPRFRSLCALAHSFKLSVIMHSCGKLTAIIPDLIECGIDVFQFDQPRIHSIDTLAAFQKHNRVTFWCPVDIQTTLQSHDENLIRNEVRELLKVLWQGRGGFIAGLYPDPASIGIDPSWQSIASDEFLKRGVSEQV